MRSSLLLICILLTLGFASLHFAAVRAEEDVLLNWFRAKDPFELPAQPVVADEEVVLNDEQISPVALLSDDAHTLAGANTLGAASASVEILNEINYARTNPHTYAILLKDAKSAYLNSVAPVNSKARAEAVQYLSKIKPRPALQVDQQLCTLGTIYMQKLVDDNSFTKGDMTERWKKAKCFFRESLAAGAVTPRDVVMGLIVDSRDKRKYNRRHLFTRLATGACAVAKRSTSYRYGSIAGFYTRQKSCFGFEMKQPDENQLTFAHQVVREINLARQKPKEYARLVEIHKSATINAISAPGSSTRRDAIAFLQKTRPLPALKFDSPLCAYGQQHLNNLVSTNTFTHGNLVARYKQAKCFFNEVLAAGETSSPRDTVLAWLIDVQDPLKTNRKSLFNGKAVGACAAQAGGSNYTYKKVVALFTREATCHGYDK